MSGEDSRLATVLGELADLGRRISERAAELAGLVVEGGDAAPGGLADRVAEVRSSVADLAAAAAVVSEATDQSHPPAAEACPTTKASKRTSSRRARSLPDASRGTARGRRRAVAGPSLRVPAGRPELRRLMPAAVSVAVNLAVILGLAVIFVAAEAKPRQVAIEIGTAAEPAIDEMMPVELDAGAEAAAADEAAAESLPELEALAIEPAVVDDMAVDDAAFAVDPTAVVPVSFDSADVLAAVGGSGGTGDGPGGGGEEAGGGRQGWCSSLLVPPVGRGRPTRRDRAPARTPVRSRAGAGPRFPTGSGGVAGS